MVHASKLSNGTHNNSWKGNRAKKSQESEAFRQYKQEEARLLESQLHGRLNPDEREQPWKGAVVQGYPRVPKSMDPFLDRGLDTKGHPFPERGPAQIFKEGIISPYRAFKRIFFSKEGLKVAAYGLVSALQMKYDLRLTQRGMVSWEEMGPLSPEAYRNHVKIPTAETKGQPDSHAGSQLPVQPKQEKSFESQSTFLLPGASADPRREPMDYVDEDELELRQMHEDRIKQQDAIAALASGQIPQTNTTTLAETVTPRVANGDPETQPPIASGNNGAMPPLHDSAVHNSSLSLSAQDNVHTNADKLIERIWNQTITRDYVLAGGGHGHHRTRHTDKKLHLLDREIGRDINRLVRQVCHDYLEEQRRQGVLPERCEGAVAKRLVRERIRQRLIEKNPLIKKLSEAEQNLKVSQWLATAAYDPDLNRPRKGVKKSLQPKNEPLLLDAGRDARSAAHISNGVKPAITTPSAVENHINSTVLESESLQTNNNTVLQSDKQFEWTLPPQHNETERSVLDQKLSHYKNLTRNMQGIPEEQHSSRLFGVMRLMRQAIDQWEQGSWENIDSPLEAINKILENWMIHLKMDYRQNLGSAEKLVAECDEVCVGELARNDIARYLTKQDVSFANLPQEEKDASISQFLVDLAYASPRENIIAKYQEQLQNGTVGEAQELIQQVGSEQWRLGGNFQNPDHQAVFRDSFFEVHAPFLTGVENAGSLYGSDDHINEVVGQQLAAAGNISLADNETLNFYEQLELKLAQMEPGPQKDEILTKMVWMRALINGKINGRDEEIARNLIASDPETQLAFINRLIEEDTSLSPRMKKLEEFTQNRMALLSQIEPIPEFRDHIDVLVKQEGIQGQRLIECGERRAPASHLGAINWRTVSGNVTEVITQEFQKDPLKNVPLPYPNDDRTRYCKVGQKLLFQNEVWKEYAKEIRKITANNVRKYEQVLESAAKFLVGDDYAPTAVWELHAHVNHQSDILSHDLPFKLPSPAARIMEFSNGNQTRLLLIRTSESGDLEAKILSEQNAAGYLLDSNNIHLSFRERSVKVTKRRIGGPEGVWPEERVTREENLQFRANAIEGKTKKEFFHHVAKHAGNVQEAHQLADNLEKGVAQPSVFRTLANLFMPLGSCALRGADAIGLTDLLGVGPEGDRKQENRNNEIGCAIDLAFMAIPVGYGAAKSGLKYLNKEFKSLVLKKVVFPSHLPSKKLVEQITNINNVMAFRAKNLFKSSPNLLTSVAIQHSLGSAESLSRMQKMIQELIQERGGRSIKGILKAATRSD
ncbi:MAG: hypothetical protein C5B47_04445, partial [Verrucomicrobia bacterium]